MKKIVSILVCLLAVVVLVCNFMGTRRAAQSVTETITETPAAETAQPADTRAQASAVPEPSEISVTEVSVTPELDVQYQCIADHFSLWQAVGDYEPSGPMYTVVDLDGNGRLEVICAVCEGSGLYTTAWFYEVNADASGMTAINYDVTEGDSEPDIMVDTVDVFTGGTVHWYIFADILRNGMAEHFDIIYAVAKQGTDILKQHIATEHYVSDMSTGAETETYTDAVGNEITADAFDSAAADFFTGCDHHTRSIRWYSLSTSDDLIAFARDSYEAFVNSMD